MGKHDKREEKDEPPYTQFKYCKNKCFACNECGLFYGPGAGEDLNGKHVPERPNSIKMMTADSVRAAILPKQDAYYTKLSVGQTSTWVCDERTRELFCLSQWIMEELIRLNCPEEDRHRQQWAFNRKARAEDDLYALAALIVNGFLTGKIDKYRGR